MNQLENLLKQNNYWLAQWSLDFTTSEAEAFCSISIKPNNQVVIVATEKYNAEQLASVFEHLSKVLRNNQPGQIIEFKP